MPVTRALMIPVAIAVVLISFAVTTYVLNRASPETDVANQPSGSGSSTQTNPAPNLVLSSQDFASWQRYQVAAVDSAVAAAPDGKSSAAQLIESSDNGRHFITTTVTGATPGAVHTFSFYFKPGARGIGFEMRDSTPGKYGVVMCDVSKAGPSGSNWVKSGDAIDAAVEQIRNGWYRCWGAMPFSLANVVLGIELRDQTGKIEYQGDGHSGELIWGARFERGNRPAANLGTSTDPAINTN